MNPFFGGKFFSGGFYQTLTEGDFFYGQFFEGQFFEGGNPTPQRVEWGGPGGSNKAGKKLRKRRVQSPRPGGIIQWGKTSELLIEALPEDTPFQSVITDLVIEHLENLESDVYSLQQVVSVALAIFEQATIARPVANHQMKIYTEKLKANFKKLKRRSEDEFIISLLGVV